MRPDAAANRIMVTRAGVDYPARRPWHQPLCAYGITIFRAETGMIDDPDSLVGGLQALATLARRGPLDTARLARLNGWRMSYTAALVGVLETEGLVRRIGDPARLVVTPRAVALVGGQPQWLH